MMERLIVFAGLLLLTGWFWVMVSWAEDDMRLRIKRGGMR